MGMWIDPRGSNDELRSETENIECRRKDSYRD